MLSNRSGNRSAQQTDMGRLLSEESPDTLVTNPGSETEVLGA